MTDTGVHLLETKAAWEDALKEDGLLVLDCYATWCAPCKLIAPKVSKFASEFPKVRFYKIDVDDLSELAAELNIRAMPTFLLFNKGRKVGEVVGANPKELLTAIQNNLESEA